MSDSLNRPRCFLVAKSNGGIVASISEQSLTALPPGEVTIAVRYSALNYKDALAASGHPGIALQLPLVPGIDAVGIVRESESPDFSAGQSVVVKAADFGTRVWGGWGNLARVPAQWCYHLPSGLNELQTVTLGTAGFTAAQCVDQLIKHDVRPDSGPVVVSGSTGGVGVFAVMILGKLGYHVVASTGKPEKESWLRELGASEVISRSDLDDRTERPLLSGRWAGAVDTVGGNTLATILRATKVRGCVTACGLVAGHELSMTVYPFILRGVTLQGIDSANTTRKMSERIWGMLGREFRLDELEKVATVIPLDDISAVVAAMLNGKVAGRTVVRLGDT
jgi:putative YhdH/YhfP family quinone oxidoreductase